MPPPLFFDKHECRRVVAPSSSFHSIPVFFLPPPLLRPVQVKLQVKKGGGGGMGGMGGRESLLRVCALRGGKEEEEEEEEERHERLLPRRSCPKPTGRMERGGGGE